MSNLTYRLVKGIPLTNQEVDDNFSALDTDKLEVDDLLADVVSYNNTNSDLLAETVQAAIRELELGKISTGDLRVGVTLFPTDTIYTGSEYLAVDNTADAEYNTVGVDVGTGGVSAGGLIATVTSEAGVAVGEVQGVNVSLVGEIRKTAGNQNEYANFYFEVYHRDFSTSLDTLIATSGKTLDVESSSYEEYVANAFIQGPVEFAEEDRLVLKFYAGDVSANSPEYDLLFGGSTPIRFSMPIALANVSSISDASDVIVATGSFSGLLNAADIDVQTALETLDVSAIGEAPQDGNQYIRQNGSWSQLSVDSDELDLVFFRSKTDRKSLNAIYPQAVAAYYNMYTDFGWGADAIDSDLGIFELDFGTDQYAVYGGWVAKDAWYTGDLDVSELKFEAALAVGSSTFAEVIAEVGSYDGSTFTPIGTTAGQLVNNTAFNDFDFDFYGASFTRTANSSYVGPRSQLYIQIKARNPLNTGNAQLRMRYSEPNNPAFNTKVKLTINNYLEDVHEFTPEVGDGEFWQSTEITYRHRKREFVRENNYQFITGDQQFSSGGAASWEASQHTFTSDVTDIIFNSEDDILGDAQDRIAFNAGGDIELNASDDIFLRALDTTRIWGDNTITVRTGADDIDFEPSKGMRLFFSDAYATDPRSDQGFEIWDSLLNQRYFHAPVIGDIRVGWGKLFVLANASDINTITLDPNTETITAGTIVIDGTDEVITSGLVEIDGVAGTVTANGVVLTGGSGGGDVTQSDLDALELSLTALINAKVGEAPEDGKTYVRQNAAWTRVDLGLDLLVYPFDGGLADTVYFAETMDGGDSATLVFDDAISPVIGGTASSTYTVSPIISGGANMSTVDGGNFNIDGGRSRTTLFSSNFDGGAA